MSSAKPEETAFVTSTPIQSESSNNQDSPAYLQIDYKDTFEDISSATNDALTDNRQDDSVSHRSFDAITSDSLKCKSEIFK